MSLNVGDTKKIGDNYRNLLIIESRACIDFHTIDFDPKQDLVLTYDFALKREIEALNGDVFYIDNVCTPDEMQKNNFQATEFLQKWHYDDSGHDIFTADGIPFGFAFRIEFWSEYIHYVSLRANLAKLNNMQYKQLYLAETVSLVADVLHDMRVPFTTLIQSDVKQKSAYFFDIHHYMQIALHGDTLRDKAKNAVTRILSTLNFCIDRLLSAKNKHKNIYAQVYHPTKKIIDQLQQNKSLRVTTSALTARDSWKKLFNQRLIPITGDLALLQDQANILLARLRANRCAVLCLADGTDVTEGAHRVIESKIKARMPHAIRIVKSVLRYVEQRPIDLEVMIANLGLIQAIVHSVLNTKKVPSYLIINGLLNRHFQDEAKYADYINGYSLSIKQYYFNNADNVCCLGDPRMDSYVADNVILPEINRTLPTVSIGTAGFNNIDLISHLAIEFDFMFDILSAFDEAQHEGSAFKLIIKVRPNGFVEQYQDFVAEYFPKLQVEIIKDISMADLLAKTDFYITSYSQTLFEASCLGIPVVYYKKDKEVLDAPFDSNCELVTVDTKEAMKAAFYDFKSNHARYNAFLTHSIMEKYVGPLDGKNLDRNLAFIHELLNAKNNEVMH